MNETILGILGFALVALGAPLGHLIGKLIKEKINSIKHQSLQHALWVLVRAAEKIFDGNSRGIEKYEYVIERIVKKFPWASNLKLREFIEAEVSAMRMELGNVESSYIEE